MSAVLFPSLGKFETDEIKLRMFSESLVMNSITLSSERASKGTSFLGGRHTFPLLFSTSVVILRHRKLCGRDSAPETASLNTSNLMEVSLLRS